jgi:hypothetical protein
MALEHIAGAFRKPRSRVTVGFHRVGVVLAAPLLAVAVVAAVWQWRDPSGPVVMVPPEGSLGWGFGEDTDATTQQIVAEQHRAGFNLPNGFIILGAPLGVVRQNDTDWSQYQLPDGRKIGVASTDEKKNYAVIKDFLLADAKADHAFTEKDTLSFEDVTVRIFDDFIPDIPPWQHKQRDWTIALLSLCAGLSAYIAMRALGWVINGFTARS